MSNKQNLSDVLDCHEKEAEKEIPCIKSIMDEHKKSKIENWAVRSNWASQMGDKCLRKLVYQRTDYEKKTMHHVDLQYIFDEGNQQELALSIELKISLMKAGVELIGEQQRISIPNTEISGKIDGFIKKGRETWPIEIKSMSPQIFQQIRTFDDLDRYEWTAKYPAQILLYMYAEKKDFGILLLKCKSSGQLRQINIKLQPNLEYVRSLIAKDGMIAEHMKNKTQPPRLNDPDVCARCQFVHVCCPDIIINPLDFLDDDEFELEIDEMMALKEASSNYDRMNKRIKSMLKEKEKLVVGKYLVTGKFINKRESLVKASVYWKSKIERIEEVGNEV